MSHDPLSRRAVLAGAIAVGFADAAFAQDLPLTPACEEKGAPTIAQTPGPFFKPRSPQRADLIEPGAGGRPVELTGVILTRSCRPVGGALVDLWHSDDKGDYDDKGYRYRGHVFADAEGRYRFRTIRPARYPGRTRHYHVRVQAPNRPVLTTQLYFPNEMTNRRDGLFRPELLMQVADAGDGMTARFDFVLDIR
jgi:protocatechuate 3,4-dioxygenase beta subunit